MGIIYLTNNNYWSSLISDCFLLGLLGCFLIKLRYYFLKRLSERNFAILLTKWQNCERSRLLIIAETLPNVERNKYYDIDSTEDTTRFIRDLQTMNHSKNLDIILHTSGGNSNNAKLMIDALINHKGRRRVYIPNKAYSAGTLISLTGNQIYMNKNAHLSPIDTQITINNDNLFNTQIPVNILRNITHFTRSDHANLLYIHAKMAEKEYYADLKMLDTIFTKLYAPIQRQKIIGGFLRTQLPHDYPISVKEARQFGLNISCHVPQLLKEVEAYFEV
jgi:uncharacterized protein YpiB (UPF0302 family)